MYKKALDARNASLDAANTRYLTEAGTWDTCVSGAAGASCARPTVPADPGAFLLRPQGNPTPTAPTITPAQAAYIAFVRLHLTPPTPIIGPSPDLNEWHIAAVGYPLWLSAGGTLNPAPVTSTVEDLTVTLTPHLTAITYDMGDGHKQTCTDNTHPWRPGTTPGTPSPSCGYTYTKPSLPHGRYTITATTHWTIAWAVNGQGGTIPLYEQATTTLPVGELQVLIR